MFRVHVHATPCDCHTAAVRRVRLAVALCAHRTFTSNRSQSTGWYCTVCLVPGVASAGENKIFTGESNDPQRKQERRVVEKARAMSAEAVERLFAAKLQADFGRVMRALKAQDAEGVGSITRRAVREVLRSYGIIASDREYAKFCKKYKCLSSATKKVRVFIMPGAAEQCPPATNAPPLLLRARAAPWICHAADGAPVPPRRRAGAHSIDVAWNLDCSLPT